MRYLFLIGLVLGFNLNTLLAEDETKVEPQQSIVEYIQELTGKIDELTRTFDELQKRITLLEVTSCSQQKDLPQKETPNIKEPDPTQKAKTKPSASAEGLWNEGMSALQHKNFTTAENAFTEFLRFYPENTHATEASYWLGEVLLMRKKYAEAQKYYAIAYKAFTESDSRKSEVGLKIAECYFGLNKKKRAAFS